MNFESTQSHAEIVSIKLVFFLLPQNFLQYFELLLTWLSIKKYQKLLTLVTLCQIFVAQQQCDQIGPFLKLLVTNYIWKVAQMFGDFWVFWKHHFLSKNYIVYFLGNLRKNLATFLIHYLVTLHNNNDSFKKIASFCCCEKTAARISTSCKSRYTKLLR